VARATTPGSFVVPPPRAEEMYHPETFGRGGTDRLVVEEASSPGRVAGREAWPDTAQLARLFFPRNSSRDTEDVDEARPPACRGFKSTWPPADHVPYPPIGHPWPVAGASADIVINSRVPYLRAPRLLPLTAEDVREALMRSSVVSRDEWISASHIALLEEESAWLVAGESCYRFFAGGGLDWIAYPDGTAVYLAGCCCGVKDGKEGTPGPSGPEGP